MGIDTSRRMQVERKRAQTDREKAEEHELSTFWKEWCGRLDELDEQEKTQRRLAAKKLAQEQLMQKVFASAARKRRSAANRLSRSPPSPPWRPTLWSSTSMQRSRSRNTRPKERISFRSSMNCGASGSVCLSKRR